MSAMLSLECGNEWTHKVERYQAIMSQHGIPARHESAFVELVETGDVGHDATGFLADFERSRPYQDAVEEAFALRVGDLQAAIRSLAP
ncbi:MAG: hypothetical protein ACRC33_15275 [Gemmataceae bacterium]